PPGEIVANGLDPFASQAGHAPQSPVGGRPLHFFQRAYAQGASNAFGESGADAGQGGEKIAALPLATQALGKARPTVPQQLADRARNRLADGLQTLEPTAALALEDAGQRLGRAAHRE